MGALSWELSWEGKQNSHHLVWLVTRALGWPHMRTRAEFSVFEHLKGQNGRIWLQTVLNSHLTWSLNHHHHFQSQTTGQIESWFQHEWFCSQMFSPCSHPLKLGVIWSHFQWIQRPFQPVIDCVIVRCENSHEKLSFLTGLKGENTILAHMRNLNSLCLSAGESSRIVCPLMRVLMRVPPSWCDVWLLAVQIDR